MTPSRTALVVMARYPAVGAVKTRLARTLGSARACALYRAFLRDIDMRFAGGRRVLLWAFHPPDSDFPSLLTSGAACLPQRGADLGERMHNCFRRLCGDGFAPVLMIGADVPHVRDEWLDEAEERLAEVDVVLGPTADGGYYLVAMRNAHDVFTGVPLSTPRVLAETCQKAARAGLRVHLLPASFDVDGEDDLARLRRLLARGEYAGLLPSTTALLGDWR
jgi:rSAM/selenodomain-associated transferase 1